VCDDRREQARKRVVAPGGDDWRTVALALKLDLSVCSGDRDLATAGVEVFTTGELLVVRRDGAHDQ